LCNIVKELVVGHDEGSRGGKEGDDKIGDSQNDAVEWRSTTVPGERLKNEGEERKEGSEQMRGGRGGGKRKDEKIIETEEEEETEEPLCLYLLDSRHLARNTDRKSPRCPSPKSMGWPGDGGCAGGRPVWARGGGRAASRCDAATAVAVAVAVAAAIDDDIWNR